MTTIRSGRHARSDLTEDRPGRTDRAVSSYVGGLTAGCLVLALVGWQVTGSIAWQPALLLVVLGVLGASLREREVHPHVGVSVATVILAAALPLAGPAGAAVVGYLSYLGDMRAQRLRARLFNAAMTGCMGATGGLTYLLVGGLLPVPAGASPSALILRVALPLVMGYGLMTVVNVLLIGVMSRLVRGVRVLPTARRLLGQVGPGYLIHAFIAFLFVVLWAPVGVGIFSAVLVVGPLLSAQWTLSRDAAERRSHTQTVKTFVAALEAANPYTVGHSSRIAELCRRMAPRLGVHGAGAESLHYAALLHDIGLVAVGHTLPRGTGPVGVDYLVAVIPHPDAGVRMLEDITFLRDALPGILHHHERMDGRGYPAGLADRQIPLFARMIAVADAFDSLTATRSYREPATAEQALEVLRARQGTHLDPEVVTALTESLQGHPWRPTVIEDELRSAYGDAHDHDDPMVSDLYAEWSPEGARDR